MDASGQVFDCLCRTCMHELAETISFEANNKLEQQWKSIFDTVEECGSLHIAELISKTIPHIIKVHLSDELPKKICRECLEQLQNVYRFQQMCLKSDQQMRKSIAKINADFKMTTNETATGLDKISTMQDKLSVDKEQRIEFQSVNTLPEASQTNSVDPLQSIEEHCKHSKDDALEIVKNEPCDDDEHNVEPSDGETLHSTITIKNEDVTEDEEQASLISSTHICPLCNKSFKQLRLLKYHLKRHKKWDEEKDIPVLPKEKLEYCRFKCEICNRYFHKPESLHKHRLAHDENVDNKLHSYTCEVCNKTLSSRHTLWNHKRNVHSEKSRKPMKKYSCENCDKFFSNSLALRNHVRTHTGERPYLCPECGRSFSTGSTLSQHRLRHGAKAFECPHCPSKFHCSSDLSKHKLTHDVIKRHICDICGYRFAKSHELATHKNYHNGVRRYQCSYCDKRFVTGDANRRHMRTHTGEKPYKCKYCERAFAQPNDYTKHLRTHIGDNVYRCELCPSAYRLASELRIHFATHKNDDEETRERNMKALKEEEAKIQLKLANKETQQPSA